MRIGHLIPTTDMPLVVDVHTEPTTRQVLEVGTGYPIVVVRDKNLRGARFNCYEFKHPINDRLTDESWQLAP
ncbi:MAG: DUF3160 domain-containing protein [Nitrospirae bacterium]|nr:DUF3160 domain-containing protein [Nitrospirota bacterium]